VLSTAFTTPSFATAVSSTFTLGLVTTSNTSDPDASADFVNLPTTFTPAVFTINGTNYTLKLVGFSDVVGDGFLVSDTTTFHVREGGTASAQLLAEVTTDVSGSVPEPSTWAMMILGFAGIGTMAYRRRRQGARFA